MEEEDLRREWLTLVHLERRLVNGGDGGGGHISSTVAAPL